MTWKLFIDDIRTPLTPGWFVVTTCEAAIRLIEDMGLPEAISFDHDLGLNSYFEEITTKPLMNYLVEGHLNKDFNCAEIKTVIVHSANFCGAQNLLGLWNNFAEVHDLPSRAIYEPRA